ncbi:MAG TPA: hypothetical protein VMU80_21995 [Bryobacteraceae bacterium]|nr:hypothetical protein [Bryobacteraceae bacterium]
MAAIASSLASVSASGDKELSPTAQKLKDLIEDELDRNQSLNTVTDGDEVILKDSYPKFATAAQVETVNNIGQRTGCHTCGSHIETDPDQPWIGDHSYPTNLEKFALEALMKNDDRYEKRDSIYLFPQCYECSNEQATLVHTLNGLDAKGIADKLKDAGEKERIYRLIHGDDKAPVPYTNCISSSGDKVTVNEGAYIQKLGTTLGCHSNKNHRVPSRRYIADHIVPREFCTAYFPVLCEKLGVDLPTKFALRPQCPRCSGNQGGNMSAITKLAIQVSAELGVAVGKDTLLAGAIRRVAQTKAQLAAVRQKRLAQITQKRAAGAIVQAEKDARRAAKRAEAKVRKEAAAAAAAAAASSSASSSSSST